MISVGNSSDQLNERLANSGFRFTPHRRQVYDVLVQHRDHPTAEEVFIRAKKVMPDISMATVYNCLDALVKSGLVRLVNLDRGATRFCPNMADHGHFVCDRCGGVFDVGLPPASLGMQIEIPSGFKVNRYDIAFHGQCPSCASQG